MVGDDTKMSFGPATVGFMSSPAKFSTVEFFGIAFIIVAISLYWSHFVNENV